jgi:DNA-binding transcriptional LysR family regulator
MAAQDLALMTGNEPRRELTIAISDHVAGSELPDILARVNAYDPGLTLKVRVDYSRKVLADFDHGEADVAVVRHQGRRRDGEVLFEDSYGWFASMSARFEEKPLPLITVTESCGVRELAIRLLTHAKVRWVDAFLGGGVATAMSAAHSGIGILPLPRRLANGGLIEVGESLGLPPFPSAKVMMYSRRVDGHTKATLRVLGSAFRSASSRG